MRFILARLDDGVGSTKGAIGGLGNDIYSVRVFYRELGILNDAHEGFPVYALPE